MRTLLIGFLLLSWCACLSANTMSWGYLRDGDLYLTAQEASTLSVNWKPAWQADANHEQLYLLDGNGRLIEQVEIEPRQTYGSRQLRLQSSAGPYRFVVPGYSFRAYRISHSARVSALFEPVRVHFNSEVPRATELYFRVAADEQAILSGKYHGGVDMLQATRLSDGLQVRLPLHKYKDYWRFDSQPLAASGQDEVWRLSLIGQGKAAYWLDGTENLFAQSLHHLRPLEHRPGRVHIQLSSQDVGRTPDLGVALPYADPPVSSHALLDSLGVGAATYYSFVDVLPDEPEREINYRRLYAHTFDINTSVTLLAGTGRRAVLDADSQTLAGLRAWLDDSVAVKGSVHYLGFADEPNLNYPDYATFARYFARMLDAFEKDTRGRAAGVRVAVPASSRLLDGPFRPGSARRRGIDWTEALLQEHGSAIDAVAWHEWMVRDLLATRRYRQSVQAAAHLVGLDEQGRPRKALLLDQTNISSGASLSPYEQETHFAALWWASVVVNASLDGLLDVLGWFQAADEPDYPKGMLRQLSVNEFAPKPVALAQAFIGRHWLPRVFRLDNDAFEVDVLSMGAEAPQTLLGVNKVARQQDVIVSGITGNCSGVRLDLLEAEGETVGAPVTCSDGTSHFRLPARSLFILTWEIK